MALQLVSVSLGAYFSALLVQLVELSTQGAPWITENLNEGRLHYFFFLLAALMLVNVGLFGFVARRFNSSSDPGKPAMALDEPKAARDRL